MRLLATVVLGLVAAVNLLGLVFLTFSWYVSLGFHARGGTSSVIASAVVGALCLAAISRLHRLSMAVA